MSRIRHVSPVWNGASDILEATLYGTVTMEELPSTSEMTSASGTFVSEASGNCTVGFLTNRTVPVCMSRTYALFARRVISANAEAGFHVIATRAAPACDCFEGGFGMVIANTISVMASKKSAIIVRPAIFFLC